MVVKGISFGFPGEGSALRGRWLFVGLLSTLARLEIRRGEDDQAQTFLLQVADTSANRDPAL